MRYHVYSTEDFIADDFFQQWVRFPNEERDQFWEDFLLQYPSQETKVQEAREFLLAIEAESSVPESVIKEMKEHINSAIDEYERARVCGKGSSGNAPTVQRRASFTTRLYRRAACLLILALGISYYLVEKDIPLLETLGFEQEVTPLGRQQHIVLSDGTHIWLNADSKLKYPKAFSDKTTREVYLSGEAFFEVAEDVDKPFVVHASGIAIRVLGTAFNVRSYEEDQVVATTLVRGKVSIVSSSGDTEGEVTLLPNQQALVSKKSKIIALEEAVDPNDYIGWKSGWMIFDDKPFSFIKETLERWYDVTIIMEDEQSLSCTFSAKFRDKTLREVLEIFKNTETINYKIEGDQVFINGKLCQFER